MAKVIPLNLNARATDLPSTLAAGIKTHRLQWCKTSVGPQNL